MVSQMSFTLIKTITQKLIILSKINPFKY